MSLIEQKLIELYKPLKQHEIKAQLSLAIAAKLAKTKSAPLMGDLVSECSIIKYNATETMFKGKWNALTVQAARGHVVDVELNPVNMPFPKMFNVGEMGLTFRDDDVVAMHRKRNGFMITAFVRNDVVQFASTGTTDSDYVNLAASMFTNAIREEIIKLNREMFPDGLTLIFEVCHDSDPHIIPEVQGLYLLGARVNNWSAVYLNQRLTGVCAERLRKHGVFFDHYTYQRFSDAKRIAKQCDHEGFVIWGQCGTIYDVPLKIKSDIYLVSKLLARSNVNNIVKRVLDFKARNAENEEFWPLFDHIQENMSTFAVADEQTRLSLIRNFIKETNLKGT